MQRPTAARRLLLPAVAAATAALFVASRSAIADQPNLAENPSFEGGSGSFMPGWGSFSNAYASNNGDEVPALTGSGVGKLFGPFSGDFGVSGFFQAFEATPGATYQYHVSSRHNTGDDLSIGAADNWVLERLTFFNGSDELLDAAAQSRILDATFAKDTWINNAVVTATAPANAGTVNIYVLFLQPTNQGGAAFVDDANFVKLPAWGNDADGDWSNRESWDDNVPNAVGDGAAFTGAITAPHTVFVDGPKTVGSLVFNSTHAYTLSGQGPISLQSNYAAAVIDVKAGTHTIDTPVAFDSPGTIQLETDGTGLTFGAAGSLDLKDKPVVVDYTGSSPADTIAAQLLAGRNGGFWNGAGILSSTAAANAAHTTAIAYAEASDLLGLSGAATAHWNGQNVDATSILLKYTYYGDLNMDGKVNADDYVRLDRGRAKNLTGWINGDVNYNGTVDGADYALVDASFIQQGGTLSPEQLAARLAEFGPDYSTTFAAAIPEPTTLAACGLALPFLSRRHRRRSSPLSR